MLFIKDHIYIIKLGTMLLNEYDNKRNWTWKLYGMTFPKIFKNILNTLIILKFAVY